MSIDPNLVGKQFVASQFSLGNHSGTDPVTYTETDQGSELGQNTVITINSVTTSGDVTTIDATVSGSTAFGGAANGSVTGTVIANNTSSIVLTGMLDGQQGTVFLTNNSANQPGVNNSTMVPAASDNDAYVAPCFVTGTLIGTARGDVAVEALVVGDLVVTAAGALRPIRWIGHRTVACRGHRSYDLMPIRVAAQAFGEGRPSRDLFLSPGHPVLVGADEDAAGVLVPIMCLVNGTTIERIDVDEVTYWHVELEAHDILLAEGLPAESYLDWGDRPFFAEAADHALTNPDFVLPGLAGRCRPVVVDGPIVEAERRRIDRMLAMRLASACAWPLDGDALFVEA